MRPATRNAPSPPGGRGSRLAALSLLLACGGFGARADALDDAFAAWARPDGPGCAVGVARKGEATVFRAYGMADLERGARVTPDTVFEAGSVSKQFTAATVLMLIEEGKLGLSDDIRKHLPEMPDYGAPITIEHLLTHTSGLRDWSDLADFTGWPRYTRVYDNEDALAMMARQRALNHPPGAAYSYTNTGYNLLAIIVQRATGRTLAEVTHERLFQRLGMGHTGWRDDFRRLVPGRALGYLKDGDRFVLGMPFENAYGSGGLLTTVGDLLVWNAALAEGRLGPFVTDKLQEPAVVAGGRKVNYGRGLMLTTYRGQHEIFHNGGTAGYQAWTGRYPEQDLSIALLCNGRGVGPDTQAHKVAALYLTAVPAAAPASPASPALAEDLRAVPGVYLQQGAFSMLRVVADGDNLRLADGQVLPPSGPGRYRFNTSELVFRPDGTMERHMAGGDVRHFTREAPVATADLTGLAGRYTSDEAGGVFLLSARDGRLTMTPIDHPAGAIVLTPLVKDGFTAPGLLMRVARGRSGQVEGLRFQTARVWDLRLRRID